MDPLTIIPIASTSALAFYVMLLIIIVSPAFRAWLGTRLDMPEPSTHSYLGPLNAFRVMAALYVACFHAWQWPQPVFDATASMLPFIKAGAKAVPMFVILSGLLIYRSLRNLNSVEDFRLFLRRWFLRIFPLYGTTVLVLVLWHRYPYASFPLQHYIADAFMLRSLDFPGFINPPAWSLYVEIAFYLLLPAYVIAVGGRTLSVTIVTALIFAMTDVFGPRELMLWKYFCIGVLVCLAVERWRGKLRRNGRSGSSWQEWYSWQLMLAGISTGSACLSDDSCR
jgi:peptidoglycan/LPS O-acetylase OafA/YrhL